MKRLLIKLHWVLDGIRILVQFYIVVQAALESRAACTATAGPVDVIFIEKTMTFRLLEQLNR